MRRLEHARVGRIDYLREGYRLDWDSGGINVTATDYHCGTLHLTWGDLRELMARTGRPSGSETEGLTHLRRRSDVES
jgi:hypothetical protein